jgi:hypothetical protein
MHARRFLLLSVLALSAFGCTTAAPPPPDIVAGQRLDLAGKMDMRGNAPFAYPVVATSDGVWQLEGLSAQQAAQWQNRPVRVYGTVIRVKKNGPELPALRVDLIAPAR